MAGQQPLEKDVIIIGDGPAGLSAAIYCARANLDTLVIGKNESYLNKVGIENYLGIENAGGKEILENGRRQASSFGAEIKSGEVTGIEPAGEKYTVKTVDEIFCSKGVIIATGIKQKKPSVDGIGGFVGRGVSYCVVCDGFFYKDGKVAVLGSEDYAAKQAVELLTYTKDVILFTNSKEDSISADMKKILEDSKIKTDKRKITGLKGLDKFEGLILENGGEFTCDGLFVAVGVFGISDIAKQIPVEISEKGYLKVNKKNRTALPGIYAAGDCTGGNKQVSIAVGEGANAALNLISEIKGTEYIDYKHLK